MERAPLNPCPQWSHYSCPLLCIFTHFEYFSQKQQLFWLRCTKAGWIMSGLHSVFAFSLNLLLKRKKRMPPFFLMDRRENVQGQSFMNNTSISRWPLPRFHLWISFVWGICRLLTGSSPRTGLSVTTAQSQHLLKFGGPPQLFIN